nr:uncharacterized protein LOC127347200 [Lolium perenne]
MVDLDVFGGRKAVPPRAAAKKRDSYFPLLGSLLLSLASPPPPTSRKVERTKGRRPRSPYLPEAVLFWCGCRIDEGCCRARPPAPFAAVGLVVLGLDLPPLAVLRLVTEYVVSVGAATSSKLWSVWSCLIFPCPSTGSDISRAHPQVQMCCTPNVCTNA